MMSMKEVREGWNCSSSSGLFTIVKSSSAMICSSASPLVSHFLLFQSWFLALESMPIVVSGESRGRTSYEKA